MEKFYNYFSPSEYTLDLHINYDKTKLSGTTTIRGEVKQSPIKLHAVDMKIISIKLDGNDVDFKFEHGEIEINTERGNHEIEIAHSAEVQADMQGAYLSTYKVAGEEKRMLTTQFESHYAREAFPCVDEPEAKARFTIIITSDDAKDIILSNMPVEDEQIVGESKRVRFMQTPPMSSYLVAFIASELVSYETKSRHGVKITAYATPAQNVSDLKIGGDFAADVLDYYDDLFKVPYPLPKLDLVAIPDFDAGAMENWGLMTFREVAMLANEKSSTEQKIYISTVIAHEISHMWFGDLVTMKWWDDLWLNESVATTMELYATAQVRAEYDAWDDFYTGTVQLALRRDCLPGVQPVRVDVASVEEIDTLFDGAIVYAKGGRMIVMLMRAMGEENFFKGISDYFSQHKYANTSADDLWTALTPYAGFNVKTFMTPWLTQPGYPVIETNGNQYRFLLEKGDEPGYQYPIPHLLDDLSGHYLIKLSDAELLEKLARIDELDKEQKLRLLIDRRLLAKTDAVESVSLLPLVMAFKHEADACIWETISGIIGDLKIFFEPKSKEKQQFRDFIKELVAEQYNRLGIEARPDDTLNDTKLRPTIMALMLYANDERYLDAIEEKYASQEFNTINPDFRWTVGAALVRRNPNLSLDYFNIYKQSVDPELKGDLADAMLSVMDHDILLSYLSELRDGVIRPQDRLSFFVRLLRNYRLTSESLDWMYKNWEWLLREEGEKSIGAYPRYSAMLIKHKSDADKYHEFFDKYLDNPIVAREIKVGYSDIAARMRLIECDTPAIYKYLGEQYI